MYFKNNCVFGINELLIFKIFVLFVCFFHLIEILFYIFVVASFRAVNLKSVGWITSILSLSGEVRRANSSGKKRMLIRRAELW